MPRDEERKKNIRRVLDRYEKLLGDAEEDKFEQIESREFREYKEAERSWRKKTWYERLVRRTSFFRLSFEDMEEDHRNAIRLLNWDIEPDQIAPAALVVAGLVGIAVLALMQFQMPMLFRVFAFAMPLGMFYYMTYYPNLRAKQRVIQGSDELIQAVLYMIIYMRTSPSLEGGVGFAARHLHGVVAKDLSVVLWQVDVGQYTTVQQALEDYAARWQPYNKGFVESVSLITSATMEASPAKRNEILTEAIDRLLGFTNDKMEEFAEALKIPVMVLYGLGILLPVLGIILFPLIAMFMGGGGMAFYLAMLYNVILPGMIVILIHNLLVGRPLSLSSKQGKLREAHPGRITTELLGKTVSVPVFLISIPLFILLAYWPMTHFLPALLGTGDIPIAPSNWTLIQELMLPAAIALSAGVHLVLGYSGVVRKQEEIKEMESEFPEVLFELGNALDRGQPIELAIENAIRESGQLEITKMFRIVSNNIRQQGMTFYDAVFNDRQGAINWYPSQLISTVMEIVSESSRKGTRVAAQSAKSISKYLKNIAETQHRLEELVSDTLSSLTFLAYILAPVIAGVAVGMGSVISLAFYTIGQIAPGDTAANATASGTGTDAAAGGALQGGTPGLLEIFNFNEAIPPGILLLIVGIYLIQIAFVVGTLTVRLNEGKNPARRNVMIGKILLTSIPFYTIVVLIIVAVFGNILQGIA